MQRILSFFSVTALFVAFATAHGIAQDDHVQPVPILSGGMAFVPTVVGGQTTLTSVVAPVLMVPLGNKWLVESRVTFEGDFVHQDGTSGPFVGPVQKQVDYAELDYIANRYVTITAGRFLTPFGIYNERLYPVWVRDLQTEPLILPMEESSSDGVMLRGGIPVAKDLVVNYAAFYSALSTAPFLEADRTIGGRVGVFLPRHRVEVGFSYIHKTQDAGGNFYGAHFEWQPRRIPFDLRSEYAESSFGRGYWIEPALRLSSIERLPVLTRRTQIVGRIQQFFPNSIPSDEELPSVRTTRSEFGVNYYIADGWRTIASMGRDFSSAGNQNVWTVGMTYRFAFPLGRGGM